MATELLLILIVISLAALIIALFALARANSQSHRHPHPDPSPRQPPPPPSSHHHHHPIDVRVHPPHPSPPIADDVHALFAARRDAFGRALQPFSQIGIVHSAGAGPPMPLFGRAAPHRRHRNQYFVQTPEGGVQLSVRTAGRDCAAEMGCEELTTGDEVTIPELGTHVYTVKLHARP